jgi:hypothetical protein
MLLTCADALEPKPPRVTVPTEDAAGVDVGREDDQLLAEAPLEKLDDDVVQLPPAPPDQLENP